MVETRWNVTWETICLGCLSLARGPERQKTRRQRWLNHKTEAAVGSFQKRSTQKVMWYHYTLSQPQDCNGTIAGAADMCQWCWHYVIIGTKSQMTPLNQLPGPLKCNATINNTAGIEHWHLKLYITPKQSSQHAKCNGVINGTISIMWQETCYCHMCQNLIFP